MTTATPAMYQVDLDAARREAEVPDSLDVTFGKQLYHLPAELPLDVLQPLVDDEEFDLVGLLRRVLASESLSDGLVDALAEDPALATSTIGLIRRVFEALFGVEQFAQFLAGRPSISDYLRLVGGLSRAYGVSLGEASRSLVTSARAGATSKATSESTPMSISETSGVDQAPAPASSVSDG